MKPLLIILSVALFTLPALDARAKILDIHSPRAEKAYNQGRYKEALKGFNSVIKKMQESGANSKPGYFYRQALIMRVGALFGLGRKEEAAAEFVRLVESKTLNLLFTAHQHPEIIINVMTFRLKQEPDDTKALDWRATAYEANKKTYELAIPDRTRSIALAKSKPQRATAYARRSWPLRLMNRHEEARNDLNKAIALHPKRHMYYSRAQSNHKLGRFDDAISDMSEVIRLTTPSDKNYADRLNFRARLHWEAKHTDRALAEVNNILKRWPTHAGALELRVKIYFAQRKYELAKADLQALKEESPNHHSRVRKELRKMQKLRNGQQKQAFTKLLSSDFARKAIVMGAAVTMVPIHHMLGREGASKQWAKISGYVHKRSAIDVFAGIKPLEALPQLSGGNRKKLKATVSFIGRQRGRALKAIASQHGKDAARLLAFSSLGHFIVSLRQLGFPLSVKRPSDDMKKVAKSMELPEDIYGPFLKAAAGTDRKATLTAWKNLTAKIDGFVFDGAKSAAN